MRNLVLTATALMWLVAGTALASSPLQSAAPDAATPVGAATPTLQPVDAPDHAPNCHPFTLSKGEHSGYGFNAGGFLGADLIISNPHAWEVFWDMHTGTVDPPPPPPPINFHRHVVIATVQGMQTSGGGPNTAVLGIHREGPLFKIVVFDDERPGMLDVITNPFHVVVVDRRCLPPHGAVVFEHVAPMPESGVVAGAVVAPGDPDQPPRPLPGAHVALIPQNNDGEPWHAMSGADGSYFFVNVPPGAYELVAEKEGFEPAVLPVEVTPGARIHRVLELVPGTPAPGAIVGMVVQPGANDPASAPVPGAHVILLAPDGAIAETMSNDDGGFAFPEIAPGEYLVRAEKEGFEPEMMPVHVPPGETVEVTLVLRPLPQDAGTFAGAVLGVGPDGTEVPLHHALVRVLASNGEVAHTRTGPDGRFVFPALPAGTYVAEAHARGFIPAETEITIFPAGVTEHVFVLEPRPH